MSRLSSLAGALVCSAVVLAGGFAQAKPPHKFALARYYGEQLPRQLQSCNTCHLTDDEIAALPSDQLDPDELQPWNAFGRRLRDLGKKLAGDADPLLAAPLADRLRAIGDEDADGDGVANELELLAGTAPGRADERPADADIPALRKALAAFRESLPTYVWAPTRPVARPPVPASDAWCQNPIDAFIAAEHRRLGLEPQPPAGRHHLLRRVYLDLIGLPPTRAELQAFLADERPDAYERVVDRLLADARHGERWGRHWMDIWRYSDWAGWGQQVRDSQPHIWRWRDWIVESLNDDRPYDQMLIDMLAADELSPHDHDALRATGFLVRNYKRLSREQWLTETVDHTSRAFLGLTVKCAQCHDHMYDAISQEEYYRLRAVFEPYEVRIDPVPGGDLVQDGLARIYDAQPEATTYFYLRGDERTPDKDRPMPPGRLALLGGEGLKPAAVALPVAGFYPHLQPHATAKMLADAQAKLEAAEQALATVGERASAGKYSPVKMVAADWQVRAAAAERAALEARITAEQAKYVRTDLQPDQIRALALTASKLERQAALANAEAKLMQIESSLEELSNSTNTHESANTEQLRQQLQKQQAEARKQRDEARAACDAESDAYAPLGPTYPRTSSGRRLALARWIADERNPLTARVAVNHLWARHFGRGLVPTTDDFGANGRPPTHPALLDWLAAELLESGWSMKHIHRLIVTSNTYRLASSASEASLAVDPENHYLWRSSPRRMEAELVRDSVLYVGGSLDLTQGGPELDQQQGMEIARRSLYFRHAPEKQMPFLQLFDMAAPTECYERRESIIPQQALALANSELTIREARRLARWLSTEASNDPENYITAAFEHTLSRVPTAEELRLCHEFLTAQAAKYREGPQQFGATASSASDYLKPSSDPEIRARENLVHVLLNHHEFVTLP